MFNIVAHTNPFLRVGQNTMQAVVSVHCTSESTFQPAPLAIAVVIDRSGSMEGEKMKAAKEGAANVVQALDETILFMVVSFNDSAHVLYGPALGTQEHKKKAINAIQLVAAHSGTCMSTALNKVSTSFNADEMRAKKILLLTDGKNEGERRPVLDQAVARCAAANISVHAWGVGTDWDEKELRYIADQTNGDADIIPTPRMIGSTFTAAFNEMRKTALTDVRLALWSPVGVTIKNIQQVYPSLSGLTLNADPTNPRQHIVRLGSFAGGDQRDYLLDLHLPVYEPGQQFLLVRPSMRYIANALEEEEKSDRRGWVFAEWTVDSRQAAQINPQVAHYTNQEELSASIQEGQLALATGDTAKATRLLGKALELSEQTGNEHMTKLLNGLVQKDSYGTVKLNTSADAVARKTLAINAGRTTKLK